MKTTVELPDRLLVEAKRMAAEERRPLKALIEEGLRRVLADPAGGRVRERRIQWVTAKGGAPRETSDRVAMQKWMNRAS